MGRIKTVAVKSLGNELIKEHGSKFSTDFEKNKKVLSEIKDIESKRVRNILVGYITRRMRAIKKSGI